MSVLVFNLKTQEHQNLFFDKESDLQKFLAYHLYWVILKKE
jgi:hypothetical protein